MIKMTIGGEEVVSNKEFTINEEMLSASSTILNNCYPKSWEDNKDYTSNFYYPKDYSKFLLGEGEFLHGLNEYAILKTSGKNLFNSQAKDINKGLTWNNGILFDENKTITTDFLEKNYLKELYSNYFFVAFYYDENKNYLGNGEALIKNVTNATKHTIIPNNASITYIRITYRTSWNNNIDMTTLTDVMLTANASDLTPYMPFGENISYETNVEKEWNSFNVYGNTYQKTSTQSANLFDESYYNDDSIYTQETYKYVKARILGNRTLYFKASLKEGKTIQSGAYICISESAGKPYISGTKSAYAIRNGSITNNSADFTGVNELYINVYPNNLNVATIFDNYNLWVSTDNINYVPFVPDMPSPDYPSEIKSVGYENLFDSEDWYNTLHNIKNISMMKETVNGIEYYKFRPDGIWDYQYMLGQFKENTQYVLTCKARQYDDISVLSTGFTFVYTDGTTTSVQINLTLTEYDYEITSLPNKTISYIRLGYAYNRYVLVRNIQLLEGTQQHSYIPYGKYGIEIKNKGENLFDISKVITNATRLINNGDNLTINAPAGSSAVAGTFPNTLKDYCPELKVGDEVYLFADTTGTTKRIYLSVSVLYWDFGTKRTITQNDLNSIVYWYASGVNTSSVITNIQVKKEQDTKYKPYQSNTQLYVLDEPLRAIGQYQDKLYVNNGVLFVERIIGKYIWNGTETWNTTPYGTNSWVLNNIITTTYDADKMQIQSNIFKGIPQAKRGNLENNTIYTTSNIQIQIRNTKLDTLTKVQNATKDNYFYYKLAEPYTEPIGYVDLPNSYENINYVELGTGLETSMEVYYYWKNFNVLFAGVVKNTGDISLNPRYPHYCNLQILDYKTFLSESNTLDFVIANKTVKEAIGMVVNAISGYGFILGEINIDSADDIIGAYSTLNKTAYDVLQYLANISGSRWRARYVDSSTMAIDFYDPDTLPQGADIEYTQEYWENNNIVDLTFNYGTRDYRNKQILLSDEVYANINYNETLISNGYTNTFTLQNNIGTVVNILVGNEEKTVATTNDKQMGIDADFYYAPGKNILESNSVYSAGTLIKITYQPLVKGRQIVYNTNEVDRISTQTDTEGVIARYENRNDILSSDELEKIAQTYIEYKGKAEVILTLTTRNNDLYNIGEVVYFDAPIPDLAQNYMVKTKKTEYIVIDEIVNLFYIYEMTSSFNSEKAINYFDNQRNKASGNIAEGDSITRNIDIETDVAIIWTGGTVSSASITVDGDNVLNSVLNSPFVE